MSFNINPCKACWEKYKRGDCDINNVNSCVADTAAAFSGIPSNNFIRGTNAGENWQNCMKKMMKAQGRTPCDFQLDMAPVFNQSPHYFPSLLAESRNPQKALSSCMQKCSELRHNPKACMQNCAVDNAAVEHVNDTKENYIQECGGCPFSNVLITSIIIFLLAYILITVYRRKTN